MDSASYRFSAAASAMSASTAVAHCPPLPTERTQPSQYYSRGQGADGHNNSVRSQKMVLLQLSLSYAASTLLQISGEHKPKLKGLPYCPFFSFWMSSIPAITMLPFWKDLKPSIAETRNFIRR